MVKIGIFVSGTGTNARNIINYFARSEAARVAVVVCDRAKAPAHELLKGTGVPVVDISGAELASPERMHALLGRYEVGFIALAGFLAFVPDYLTEEYRGRMLNIHPSLLPRHGGKGMWGLRVHRDVIESGERESGVTIHYVTGLYDAGEAVLQVKCPVLKDDTPESLAARVHELEYEYYPRAIEEVIKNNINGRK